MQNWSTSNTYSWTPTVTGNFKIAVWVRSNGNGLDEPENNAYGAVDFTVNAPPTLIIADLTADLPSPQPAGTTVTFSATTTGGMAPHQYKWWVYDGVAWTVVKDWSTSSNFSWTAGRGGNYRIGVWVKSNLNPADAPEGNAYNSIQFEINSSPELVLTAINFDQISPQPAGSSITFTATTSGGLTPHQYKWWVYNGVTWSVVRDWSTSSTFSWAPGIAGNYLVGVWVKSNLNPVDAPEANAYNSIAFTVSAPGDPCQQC